MKTHIFTLAVTFDEKVTDEDSIGEAVDSLVETAASTPGILDDYGEVHIGQTEMGLSQLLSQPDTDDAHYILRQVYEMMNVPCPGFLEVG